MSIGGALMVFFMILGWMGGVFFVVATALAMYYYVAGKNEEYSRAKGIAVKLLGLVLGLAVLGILAMFSMTFRI